LVEAVSRLRINETTTIILNREDNVVKFSPAAFKGVLTQETGNINIEAANKMSGQGRAYMDLQSDLKTGSTALSHSFNHPEQADVNYKYAERR
jgi:hypothetical protein